MLRVLFTLAVSLLALCNLVSAMTWKMCSPNKTFQPDSVVLSPDPPEIGEDISFDIKGAYEHGAIQGNTLACVSLSNEWNLGTKDMFPA